MKFLLVTLAVGALAAPASQVSARFALNEFMVFPNLMLGQQTAH